MPGDEDVRLDPNKVLQEINVASRNATAEIGALTAIVKSFRYTFEEMKDDYKELRHTVKGNGGGIQEGLEYKVIALETREKECPGKQINQIKGELMKEFTALSDKVENHLETITRLTLAQKSEKAGEKKAQEKYDKDGKVIKNVILEVVTSPKVISVLVSLVVGALMSVGAMLGIQQQRKYHSGRDMRPAEVISVEEERGGPVRPGVVLPPERRPE